MAQAHLFLLDITSDMANLSRVADFVADAAQKNKTVAKTVRRRADGGGRSSHQRDGTRLHRQDHRADFHPNARGQQRTPRRNSRSGNAFNSKKVKKPNVNSPLAERSIGGLGIFFMKKLMDKVEFTRDETGNLTRMVKKLK